MDLTIERRTVRSAQAADTCQTQACGQAGKGIRSAQAADTCLT